MATIDTWKNLAEFAYQSLYSSDVSRFRIAQNPQTSLSTLEILALDSSAIVRAAVASNPRTPHHIISKLSRDQDKSVRLVLAASTETNLELLRHLALDSDEEVASLARNSFRALQAELGPQPAAAPIVQNASRAKRIA